MINPLVLREQLQAANIFLLSCLKQSALAVQYGAAADVDAYNQQMLRLDLVIAACAISLQGYGLLSPT